MVKTVIPADKGSRLGPTVYDTVAVEGISIDTGSPAIIASLEDCSQVYFQPTWSRGRHCYDGTSSVMRGRNELPKRCRC